MGFLAKSGIKQTSSFLDLFSAIYKRKIVEGHLGSQVPRLERRVRVQGSFGNEDLLAFQASLRLLLEFDMGPPAPLRGECQARVFPSLKVNGRNLSNLLLLVASLLLVVRPGAPSFLLLVAMPFAPSSFFAPLVARQLCHLIRLHLQWNIRVLHIRRGKVAQHTQVDQKLISTVLCCLT